MDTALLDSLSDSLSISPADLRARLGRPGAPLLLDVRRRPRFDASDRMLPGACYCAPEDVAALAASSPPREVVTYCVFGHEVSRDAARTLRAAGWNARWLQGGIEGGEPGVDAEADRDRWRAAALPTVPKPGGADASVAAGTAMVTKGRA